MAELKVKVEVKLNGTMDAQVWAKEFMKNFGHRLEDIDEGLMIGWFANAIMTGFDEGQSKELS